MPKGERGTAKPYHATVSDLLKLYLSDQKRQKRHSYNSADGFVRLHLTPAFGPIKASALETKHIKAFIEQKQAAEYANASINRWLEALRRAYSLGLEELPPLVYTAPNIESLMLEEDNVREGFLEHNQYLVLRDELADHQRLILVIGYHLGMRRGEILRLRWDQVDWNENLIRLEKRQTKGKKARIAPLYGELRAWLDMAYTARDPECPFIVSWQGHGISEVKTAWKKACGRAKIPELLVHDLRRTAARNMIRAGIPEKQIMLIAGWKTRNMFDRYHIVDERDIHEAGKKLARHLEEKTQLLAKVGTKVGTAEESGDLVGMSQIESIQ
jgi:integrase